MNSLLEGLRHITDIEGYDHMLFLLALCAPYAWNEWKKVVLLATAFTVGHSITLALAALRIITFSTDLVELLIPVTIAITALWNMFFIKNSPNRNDWTRYLLALGFGLIHGMGFSSYFRMMFNDTDEVVRNLLLFNIGVEVGQIFVIAIILTIAWALSRLFNLSRRSIGIAFSVLALGVSCWLIVERLTA